MLKFWLQNIRLIKHIEKGFNYTETLLKIDQLNELSYINPIKEIYV